MSLDPLHREVLVSLPPPRAFRRFVDDVGAWWPLEAFSVFGAGGTVEFVEGRIVETGPSGETAVWGTVTESREPQALAFSWHPGRTDGEASHVRVTFTPTDDPAVTLVALEHGGWEVYPDPRASRESYGSGWVTVLGRLAGGESR
ncbi:SRPBCC domain-containing protein [Isoptericola sp. NEAU-Y5]|uniref:SRPBCC domain-containing protein n=1 Tax=Isoptericola luteus TaxID=2879484 RepID=A0ABS7ZI71_9MICO|nr:SRPBCC domain-containing protein [Isoptericola sp. NEAU-Y5]MCA5894731.1 SRPBCC domain-containing protein [Isoptericola sp. NEAU-Y5]